MRLLRRLAPALIAVCAAVLTAGCVDTVVEIKINEDGSGSQRVDFTVQREFLEFLGGIAAEMAGEMGVEATDATEADLENACREMLTAENPLAGVSDAASRMDAAVESDTDASACRTSMQVHWDAEAAERIVEELSAAANADSSLQRLPGGGWRFESDAAFGEEITGEGSFYVAMMEEQGVPLPTMTLSITLPGSPLQHNADRVSGSTFTWDIDVLDPQPRIFAETVPDWPSSSYAWLLIVAVSTALLILALLPWWLPRLRGVVRSRRAPAEGGEHGTLDRDDSSEQDPA